MKTKTTARHFLSVIALMLAIMMLFSACGNQNAEVTSSDGTGDDSAVSDVSNDAQDETPSGDVSTVSTASIGSSTSSTTTPSTGNGVWAKDIYGSMPAKVKSAGIHVLMWRAYTKTEKAMVDAFQKKTGVTVRTTVTTESEYPTKLVSLVSDKDSPDVVCFSSGNFPGLVTKSLQALDTQQFRLNDSCWNKTYMDTYKINGKYFGVAMPGIWSCEDCNYVTYYSPAVLKACGVKDSEMPYTLYQSGKWDWSTQANIVRKVKAANKGYVALSLQSNDLFMLSAGVDFASYNGKQFTNNLGSVKNGSLLTQAWQQMATLRSEGCTAGWDLTNVQQGKVGLFTAIAYGLYNEGKWFDNVAGGASQLQAVPVAGPTATSAYTPVRPKVWGVAKGAKNPEGAAYFLRYYLDTANCNMSSTFYNKQFETVYNTITSSKAKKAVMVGWGVTDYVTSGAYSRICSDLTSATPANVTTVLNSKQGTVQTSIARANKDLARIK